MIFPLSETAGFFGINTDLRIDPNLTTYTVLPTSTPLPPVKSGYFSQLLNAPKLNQYHLWQSITRSINFFSVTSKTHLAQLKLHTPSSVNNSKH